MKIEVFLVDSFTRNGVGGNPAGVVLDAEDCSDKQMQTLAREVGYSETAFVCGDNECDYKVRFFTPTAEVDFCGHATLATFSVLYQNQIISAKRYLQRTKAGVLPVTVRHDGSVVMNQPLPRFFGTLEYNEITDLLNIDETVMSFTGLPIEIISTGLRDVMIPVMTDCLEMIEPDDNGIAQFCRQGNLVGFHVFELDHTASGRSAVCRNFAPLFGIPEESATGSASGALACYLSKHLQAESHEFVFEQGLTMGCPSRLFASVEYSGSEVSAVLVGGHASLNGIRKLTL